MLKFATFLPGFLCLLLLSGCSSSPVGSYQSFESGTPTYSEIARKAMEYEGIDRNPVIVIHGFLGARLTSRQTGKVVWGTLAGADSAGLEPELLRELACPFEYGKKLSLDGEGVMPAGMLDRFEVKLFGLPFHVEAYNRLIDHLAKAGYVPEGRTLPPGKRYPSLFEFFYDWRCDLPSNARRLHEFVENTRAVMRKHYERCYGVADYDVRFDLVAHSMGGLLTRYYLRYGTAELPDEGLPPPTWAGSRHISKVAIIATPNQGYADTFWELLKGLRLQTGAPLYPPGVIGTFHTYYQMMPPVETRSVVYDDNPGGEPIDLFDPAIWIQYQWGLANPKLDDTLKILLPEVENADQRRAIALDHLAKCLKRARQFVRVMQLRPEKAPAHLTVALYAGDAFQTRRRLLVNRKTGEITAVVYEAGDGKVLASSARGDLREGRPWHPYLTSPIRWSSVIYLPAAHMGITADPVFESNLIYFLLTAPPSSR